MGFFSNPSADLLVVLLIVLLIWGPKRLPGLGKQLGTGLREFKDSVTGDSKDEDEAPSKRQALPQSASVAQPPITGAPSPDPAQSPVTGAAPARESAEVGSDASS